MNKKLIALAVAGAFAGAASVANAEGSASVNGFIDTTLVLSDEASDGAGTGGTNNTEQKFTTVGELDFAASSGSVSTRLDLDVMNGGSDVEQAYVAWGLSDAATLIVGQLNNPIGLEAEDVTDLNQISHGQLYGILDGQTRDSNGGSLSGNNIRGAAVAFNAGVVDVTVGLLNDIGGTDEENSYALVLGGSFVEGLNVELGFVTQETENATTHAGNVTDLNATYGMDNWTVSAEYLTAASIIDSAFGVSGNIGFGNGLGATLRYDSVSYDATGAKDTTSTTVAGTWDAAENLEFLVEYRSDDNGTTDNSKLELEAIATF